MNFWRKSGRSTTGSETGRNCDHEGGYQKELFKQTLETLKSLEDVPVFDTYIRVDSGIEWSQDNNAPIMAYKKKAAAVQRNIWN